MNSEVKKKMKAAKEGWTEEQCKNIEKGMMSKNSQDVYNTLKVLTKIQQRKSADIEDNSGNILTKSTAVLNRRVEPIQLLLNNYELHADTTM